MRHARVSAEDAREAAADMQRKIAVLRERRKRQLAADCDVCAAHRLPSPPTNAARLPPSDIRQERKARHYEGFHDANIAMQARRIDIPHVGSRYATNTSRSASTVRCPRFPTLLVYVIRDIPVAA